MSLKHNSMPIPYKMPVNFTTPFQATAAPSQEPDGLIPSIFYSSVQWFIIAGVGVSEEAFLVSKCLASDAHLIRLPHSAA